MPLVGFPVFVLWENISLILYPINSFFMSRFQSDRCIFKVTHVRNPRLKVLLANLKKFLSFRYHRQASMSVFVHTATGSMHSRCWLRREKLWSNWNWPPKMKNSLKHKRRSKRLEIWYYFVKKFGPRSYGCAIRDLINQRALSFVFCYTRLHFAENDLKYCNYLCANT